MYLAIGSLGFFVLAATFVIEAGDGKIAAVRVTSIHDLTLRARAFEGAVVMTEGRLAYSEEHGEYQLIDDSPEGANYAVLIRDYDSQHLASMLGEHVQVSGRFGYTTEDGVFIGATLVTVTER